jgi:hypothetical protein
VERNFAGVSVVGRCVIEIGLGRVVSSAYLQVVSTSIASNVVEGPTCIEACNGPSLFPLRRYVAFESALYPIAILQSHSPCFC